jgi:hypothetical protein
MLISNSFSLFRTEGFVRERFLILSIASEELEINSLKKTPLLEKEEQPSRRINSEHLACSK